MASSDNAAHALYEGLPEARVYGLTAKRVRRASAGRSWRKAIWTLTGANDDMMRQSK